MSHTRTIATQLGAVVTGPANDRQLAKIEEFVSAANSPANVPQRVGIDPSLTVRAATLRLIGV